MKPSRPLALAALTTLLFSPSLFGQTAPAVRSSPDEEKPPTLTMEAFTVTGTNIRRLDEEKILPVTIMNADDMELRGAPTAAELFDSFSIGGPIILDEGNTLGADARGDNNSINLRGLGSGNTLVLLNGRRLPPHPISMADTGNVPSLAVNVNVLPSAAMSQVEVLRDGASAIYGTDAAGGVVNSRTRTRYDGTTIRTRGSLTEHGGGNDWNVELTHGKNFNGGRSNILFTLEFFHRDYLWLDQRKFSRNQDIRLTRNVPPPWNGLPITDSAGVIVRDNDMDNRLSTDSSYYGGFVRGNYAATGEFVGARPANNLGIITTSGSTSATLATNGTFYLIPLVDGNVGWRQTLPSHNIDDFTVNWFQNANAFKPILPKTDRLNLTSFLTHRLNENLELFGEFLGYRSDSYTQRLPNKFDVSTDHNIYISADNPFNPFGSRFYDAQGRPNADGTPRLTGAPSQVQFLTGVGVIPRDFKPRRITVHAEMFRVVTGLRGRFGNDWGWETGVNYSRNKSRDEEQFTVRESRLRAALTTSDPAKAYNPFNYIFKLVPQASTTNPFLLMIDKPYSNPDALTNSLYDNFVREGRTQLASWDLKVNGAVFPKFWGGPIGVAFGSEFRWEDYRDYRPPYSGLNPADAPYNGNPSDPTNLFFGPLENDFLAVSPNVNLYASRTVASVFGEVLVPIVGKPNRKWFARTLELSMAARNEYFSDFGNTIKPKFGLNYRPNSWMLLRSTAGQSFRAPNLVQTNTTPLQRSGSTVNDTYRSEATGLNRDSNAVPVIFRQGNANLSPETSRSLSIGAGLSLPFYRDLTVTVDYWRIKQREVIASVTATTQLLLDEELLDGAVQKALAAGTAIDQINLGSGTANYLGNPKVIRDPVAPADTAAYSTFNATRPRTSQRAPVGLLKSIVTDYVNLSGRETQGLDVGVELRLPRTRIGQGTLRGDATYLLQYDTISEPGGPKISDIQRDGRPRVRGNLGATWRTGRWTGGWLATYYGSFVDTGMATTKDIYDVLGQPDYISTYITSAGTRVYRYLVTSNITHNAYLTYTFPRRRESKWADWSVRVGVNNVFDDDPPLADADSGYQRGAGTNPRGRAYSAQLTKRF
jgi:iron complex outermembrane recepter protein